MSVMDALAKVYEVDPEAAESMIDDIVLDVLADDALDNAQLLNKSAAAYVGQRVAVAKRQLLRQYASEVAQGRYPDDEVHKAAEWLAGVEAFAVESVIRKDDDGDLFAPPGGAKWEENKHKRDSRGRFSRGVNQQRKVNPLQYASMQQRATPLRAAKDRPVNAATGLPQGVTEEQAARVQAQYEQADEILREFGASFSPAERKKIVALIQVQGQNGDIKTIEAPLDMAAHGMPDSAYGKNGLQVEDSILSIEIDSAAGAKEDVRRKVAQFNTLGAMGGSQMAAIGALGDTQRSALTSALMPRGPEEGMLNRLFSRFRSGGDVLEATGHDKMAGMARFMGEYGPIAEKVLDPKVRQTAYRYRGTEKEPDIELMRQMNSKEMDIVDAVAGEGGAGRVTDLVLAQSDLNAVGRRGKGDQMMIRGAVEGSLKHNLDQSRLNEESLTEDQLNMRVRSDVAAIHLLKTIPLDRRVAELSQKAGSILPSQGVLIDADGDVVSQAVGVGDDTYLPFDYANMKRSMKGGQYVRTRVQGGLTGEDIAAAVGNGARMATVVSSSGVHSIEFDPNLRGARGGSDKARSMYRNYLKILDAVENSGMYAQDIDSREKARLRSRAAEIAGSRTSEEYKTAYKQLESDARASIGELTEEEMDSLHQQATQTVDAEGNGRNLTEVGRNRRIDEVYQELEEQATNEKASKLRLNAEGYQVALQTLQQQFPYFIRSVNYEPLAETKQGERGFLDSRGQSPNPGKSRQRLKATDEGYMRPGGTRAASVRSGFYRTDASAPRPKEAAVGGERYKAEQAEAANQPPPPPEGPPGGPGVAPGGAPGTPGAPGVPGAPGAGGAGGNTLSSRMAGMANSARVERDRSISALQDVFTTLAGQRADNATTNLTWDQVKTGNNARVATWFFSQLDPKASLTEPDKATRIAAALSDKPSVMLAFKNALASSAGKDYFEGGNEFGPGNNTPEKAAAFVADLAMRVVDSELVTQPFVPVTGEKPNAFHTGSRPQALTINGVPVERITNSSQLNAVLSNNKPLAEMARKLGSTESGEDFRAAAEVAVDVSERIGVLKDLDRIVSAAANDEDRHKGVPIKADWYIDNVAANPERFKAKLEEMAGRKITYGDDLIKLKKETWPQPEMEAMKLQQAWTLVNAGRAINAFEMRGDVTGGPKVPGVLRGDLWTPKEEAEKADSSRPARPRLERVSKDSSPLAREISRRRLAGLTYVPTRV